MKIPCTLSYETRDNERGIPVEGTLIACGRCGASEFAFGTHQNSIERCLSTLNENCPKGENNYYEIGTRSTTSSDTPDATLLTSREELREFEEISGADRHTIATAVQNWGGAPHELTLWLPEWLAKKKPLVPKERSEQVFTGICDHETDKAWLIKQKPYSVEEWVPKSVAHAFRRGSAFPVPSVDEGGGA